MADTAIDDSELQETDGDGDAAGDDKPKGKRKLLSGKRLVIGGGALVLVLGGAWYMGMLDAFLGGGEEVAAEEETVHHQVDMVYFDLPDLLVNLATSGNKPAYLRLVVSLEMTDASAVSQLKKMMPRIIDNFQVYLRELRAEDLSGSAGVYRIKEELLARVNNAVQPLEVNDVLFKELLVQ